jgi:hypothetical protein
MTIYKVLLAEHHATWVKVEADSEDEAVKKVEDGDWWNEDIVKSDIIERMTTGDVKLYED